MGVPVFAFAAESGVALVPWSFGTLFPGPVVLWSLDAAPLLDPAAAFTIMEKKMETTLVYIGYIGIMEKKTETTT